MIDDSQFDLIERARRQARAVRAPTGSSVATTVREAQPAFAPSAALPHYRIQGEIHRGGQGVVYRAIQEGTQQDVAIKVMREGSFASPAERMRFEREAQILGGLRHPNIVTIHDCGNADGVSYFVMDYVAGQSLSEFVVQARPSVRELLRLFVKICDAVNTAHVRGIIHRDLKPSNIRIDSNGEPRVLDFGLAKVVVSGHGPVDSDESIAETGAVTQTGQFVGSLPWTSPEQAEGRREQVDLRTDVYALGVMLYQSLTGRLPYSISGSVRDVMDRVVHAIPPRPASLRRDIDKDVDTIVLKCLSKEPERRYQSAGELGRDIQRYLADEPIDARRDSVAYVLRKMLRRYRIPVALGSTAIVTVICLAAALAVLYQRQSVLRDKAEQNEKLALKERDRAERHAADARAKMRLAQQTAEFLLDQVSDQLVRVVGTNEVRRDLLRKAYEQLARLATDNPDEPALRLDMVQAHRKLGSLKAQLGEPDKATEHYRRGAALLDGLLAANPDESACLIAQAEIELGLGDIARPIDEAMSHYKRQLQVAQRLMAMSPNDSSALRRVSMGYERMAVRAGQAGAADEALAWTSKMHALKLKMVDLRPEESLYQYELSVALERLAKLTDDPTVRAEYAGRELGIRKHLIELEPKNPLYLRALSMSYEQQAVLAENLHRDDEQRVWAEKMLAIKQKLVELEPRHPLYQHDLAICYNRLGVLALKEKKLDEAAGMNGKALAIYRRLVDAEPTFERYPDDLSRGLRHLTDVAIATGSLTDAQSHLLEALEIRRKLLDSSPNKKLQRQELSALSTRVCRLSAKLQARGDHDAAARMVGKALALLPADDLKNRSRIESSLAASALGRH